MCCVGKAEEQVDLVDVQIFRSEEATGLQTAAVVCVAVDCIGELCMSEKAEEQEGEDKRNARDDAAGANTPAAVRRTSPHRLISFVSAEKNLCSYFQELLRSHSRWQRVLEASLLMSCNVSACPLCAHHQVLVLALFLVLDFLS